MYACTKVVNNGTASPSDKTYFYNFDLTGYPSPYSVIVVASDKSSYLFNPPDTSYHLIASGTTNFYIESYNNATTLNSNTITLTGNTYYTSLIYNQATGVPGISVIADDLSSPATGYCKLRTLYTILGNLPNTPAKISLVNEQTKDSIVNYNRTDIDFFRVQPLTNFTSIKAGTFSLYMDNVLAATGLPFNFSGKIFTVVIAKVPFSNGTTGYNIRYIANK